LAIDEEEEEEEEEERTRTLAARAKYFPLRGLFLEPDEDEDSEDIESKK